MLELLNCRYALTVWFSRKQQPSLPKQKADGHLSQQCGPLPLHDLQQQLQHATQVHNVAAACAPSLGRADTQALLSKQPNLDMQHVPLPQHKASNPTNSAGCAQHSNNPAMLTDLVVTNSVVTSSSENNDSHSQTSTLPQADSSSHSPHKPTHLSLDRQSKLKESSCTDSSSNMSHTADNEIQDRLFSHHHASSSQKGGQTQHDGLLMRYKPSPFRATELLQPSRSGKHSQHGTKAAGVQGHITKPGCIFVSIAAYRDPECQWTIYDLFKQAERPEAITVGVVWQVDVVEDADFVRIAGANKRRQQVRRVSGALITHSKCILNIEVTALLCNPACLNCLA